MSVLLVVELRRGEDLVTVRERTREVANLTGLSSHDQVMFTAAVSEVARNALRHAGGGSIEFAAQMLERRPMLTAAIRDTGPGAAAVAAALLASDSLADRDALSPLVGAQRLSDWFTVTTSPDPAVILGKRLPIAPAVLTAEWESRITTALAKAAPARLIDELHRQNRELLTALDVLSRRTADVERLNAELAETNRGVLALYAELDDKAESLKAASTAKSRFVSDASHELRTPLNAIISLSSLLLDRTDGELTEEQEKQVSLIRRSAVSLVELVSGMLDLAKIEAGKVDIRVAPVEVADLLAAVRGMFRPMVPPDVSLQVDDPGPLPSLLTDEGKVAQILRNLVANALKFTDRGTVRVHADTSETALQLHVSDTGIGIAPEDLERVFDDFTQVSEWRQRRTTGTGLGLPLARRLARLLGGEVSATSTPGQGSVFTVTLPLEAVLRPADATSSESLRG
jgi:signal transduction histidine kinase